MTTPTGVIKASDIANEFGYSRANNSISLGNYRVNRTVSGLSNLPLDTGVPQSGAISFDSLRGKKLNVVVDCNPTPSGPLLHSYNRYVRTLTDGTPQHFYTSTPNQEDLTGYTLEASNYFSAYVQQISGTVPLYRIFNTETGAHILTTSVNEWNLGPPWIKEEQQSPRSNLIEPIRYQIGQWGYVHPSAVANSEPIRRANRSPYDWLLTTSEVEAQNQGGIGYTYDDIQFHTPKPTSSAVQRVNARTKYDTGQDVTVIGGFKTKPDNPIDKKVWIHINGTIAPEGQTGKIIYFSTSREASSENYIYLSADGYPTLTFGPNAGGYYYSVYNGVQYSVSGNSGLKLALNGSTQVLSDDDGSRGDGDYNDLVLNAGEGSFYQSGESIFYKFGSTLINRTRCSFLTGSWDATTDLYIDIGPSGGVYGSGGNGGANSAFDGTSAIGIIATNKVVITNRGSVLPGGGGGGKGGKGNDGSYSYPTGEYDWETITTYGGGGGFGGIGQGYGYSNAAGDPGASGGGGDAGDGGQGGTGGTWGKPGDSGAPGGATDGLGGGSGGYDYVISNNGTGVSGLSVNVALNTIPT